MVASQWPIGDRSTVRFIEGFYRSLASGLPAGEALRDAKLQALRRGEPAAQWAAFTLVPPLLLYDRLQRRQLGGAN